MKKAIKLFKFKKGFTLIELLAVIVILGVLALVAVLSITKLIENSRKDAFVKSAREVVNSVRYENITSPASNKFEPLENFPNIKMINMENINTLLDKKLSDDYADSFIIMEPTNNNKWLYRICFQNNSFVLNEYETNITRESVGYADEEELCNTILDAYNLKLYVELDGGLWSGESPITINYADSIPIEEPTKTGYIFNGWIVTGTGSSYNNETKKFTMGTENAIITADWTPITYTFVYDCNGRAGSTASSIHTYDTEMALSNNTCSNVVTGTGGMVYAFLGWATSSDGDVIYSNQQSIFNLTTTNEEIINLYAKWTNLFSYPGTYEVANDSGSNWIIRFKTVGTVNFTPTISLNVDVWMIGGGGGGGGATTGGAGSYTTGGGGGGSGYVQLVPNISLTAGTSYAITVGAGGAGVNGANGKRGGESSFKLNDSVIYDGAAGGFGGLYTPTVYSGGNGGDGGCGGGGSGYGSGYASSGGGINGSGGIAVVTPLYQYQGSNGAGSGVTMCEFGQGTPGVTSTCDSGVPMYGGGGGGGAGHDTEGSYGLIGPSGTPGGGRGGGSTVKNGRTNLIAPTTGLSNTGGGGGGAANRVYHVVGGQYGASIGAAGGSGIVVMRNHRQR